MKRFIYILSFFVAAVSCQKQSAQHEETASDQISFVADIKAMDETVETKGVLITTQSIESFGVFAFDSYDSGEADVASFMVNQSVTRNSDDTWGYSPAKRWKSITLFYAYSPYVVNGDANVKASTSNGEFVVDYKVATDVENQCDFMLCEPVVQSEEAVELVFAHQLSAITFAITGDGTRKVTDMKVSGLNNYGRVTQSSDGSVVWSGLGCDASIEYDVDVVSDITPSATPQALSADGCSLLMIPQSLPSTAKVEVTTESLTDSSDIQVLQLSFDKSQKEWSANNQYLYTMNIITSDTADSADIEMNVVVVDWMENPEIPLW